MSTPMTWRESDISLLTGTTQRTSHLAFRILFGDLDSPRSRSVATIQHPLELVDRWKDQPIVKNPLENLLLILESLCLFLPRELGTDKRLECRRIVPHR